ncbi:hypothetical protein [Mycolicibacterium sp.]|uniref:hypothetical protein n=1 Tax=Mycolicibacterium sp. TaxID=2320850 RepID=UPI00355E3760
MAYNGRAVMADAAAKHGWTIHEGVDGSSGPAGELVAYERGATQILIRWTPINTATFIAKNYQCPDQEIAEGACGLITAREWIETGS